MIPEHIKNLFSNKLSFFQKLAFFHGLDFALPQPVSLMETQAPFESLQEARTITKRLGQGNSICNAMFYCFNYIKRKGPIPPKSVLRAIGQLKRRNDIVITRLVKGSGLVTLDRTE